MTNLPKENNFEILRDLNYMLNCLERIDKSFLFVFLSEGRGI